MRHACGFLGVDPAAPMDLTGESNCSEGKRVPTAVGRLLTPLATERHPHVRSRIACHWRHPLLSRAISPEATGLSEQLRRELADVVGPDVERLASWIGVLLGVGPPRSPSSQLPASGAARRTCLCLT